MVQQFNDHYKDKFYHGWKIKTDEWIFWVWACDQPGGGHKVDRKPKGFRPYYKCISAVGVQVTTTFENVRSKEVNDKGKYTKEYGASAASVLRLCEASGIEAATVLSLQIVGLEAYGVF